MQIADLNMLRNGALALVTAAAFAPQAATAGSLQERGDFGGSWSPIAPSDHYHWRYADVYLDDEPPLLLLPPGPPVNDPGYYGPLAYQDEGLGVTVVAPDVGVAVDID